MAFSSTFSTVSFIRSKQRLGNGVSSTSRYHDCRFDSLDFRGVLASLSYAFCDTVNKGLAKSVVGGARKEHTLSADGINPVGVS